MDTMESSPLTTPPMMSFDEMRTNLRAAYTKGVNDLMEKCLEQLILPTEQANLLFDFAMGSVFVAIVKVAEVQATCQGGAPVTDRKNVMNLFRQMMRDVDEQVPGMLMQLVDMMNAGPAPEAEETAA